MHAHIFSKYRQMSPNYRRSPGCKFPSLSVSMGPVDQGRLPQQQSRARTGIPLVTRPMRQRPIRPCIAYIAHAAATSWPNVSEAGPSENVRVAHRLTWTRLEHKCQYQRSSHPPPHTADLDHRLLWRTQLHIHHDIFPSFSAGQGLGYQTSNSLLRCDTGLIHHSALALGQRRAHGYGHRTSLDHQMALGQWRSRTSRPCPAADVDLPLTQPADLNTVGRGTTLD
ncbi:hypothetical protein B0H67DRAFT_167776 [Lasiosphaeris hirsuta]|uniref:Uncharacterized protein n=1 Tax=Lasiosphaeris hirsuta TaxID=260670 RepID=A0AA40DY32_9PEZI|nr:hypothetical protein B0H67DRAFT_167776 [Lasiosphaeris hirsuta]